MDQNEKWWLKPEMTRLRQANALGPGACLILSADWLAYNNGLEKGLPQSIEEIRYYQQMSVDLHSGNPEDVALPLYKEFGLSLVESRTGPVLNPDRLAGDSLDMGGSQLICFWSPRKNDGGHAVAAKIGVAFVEYFDPSYGYICFKKSQYRTFIANMFKKLYKDLVGIWVIQTVTGPLDISDQEPNVPYAEVGSVLDDYF